MPPTPLIHPLVRRGLAAGALAGAAALSLRALARPATGRQRGLLDWEEVRRVAHHRTGEHTTTLADAEGAQAEAYDGMAAELVPLMREVWGTDSLPLPPFTVLDRRGFVDRNLVIAGRLFDPIERLGAALPESPATAIGRRLASRYVGELFGFLSSRVLGQYDPVLMLAPAAEPGDAEATGLYLVEPNVRAFQQRTRVNGDHLRRWLVLHEVTHAWQFESHPWLRDHLGSLMQELLMNELTSRLAAQAEGRSDRRGPGVLTALPTTIRSQLRGAQRIQAVMSVCEGYSNFVMHRVGRDHLPDFDRLEEAFHKRSAQRPALERLIYAVTGMNMKVRQYELGEKFSQAIADQGGLVLLNRVWEGPGMLPTMTELEHPERWLQRAA